MYIRPFALPLLVIPGVATADVTPQDVWDNMVAGYGAIGLELSATLESSGDTLIANDGVASFTYPVIGGQMTATLPPMTFTALGNGTVSITTPNTFLSAITADIPEEQEQVSLDITIAQEGLTSIASGDPDDVTYVSETSSYDALVTNLVVPGEDLSSFEAQLDTEGYVSETRVTIADSVTVTNTATNRPSTVSFKVDADGIRQESDSNTGTLITNVTAIIPADVDIMNLAPALRAGLSVTGSTSSEGGTSETRTYDGDELFSEQNQVTGPSTGTFGFDADGIRLAGTGEGGSLTLSGSEFMLPFPIEIAFGPANAAFAFPLLAKEEPQPFAYGISVTEVSVADELWDLIDEGNVLDRSPITVTLDLSGELTNSFDLVDPATWEMMDQGVIPVEPNSLSINEIALGALGAMVTANGAFTFDNDDLQTFGGLPRPEGKLSAMATGLNAAIDQLVAAEILGDQDVAMPRMFMGMFAVAQGDDELTTELEINAEGHVLLNGQRIQ